MGLKALIGKMFRRSAADEVQRQTGRRKAAELREQSSPGTIYDTMKGTGTGF